MSETIYIPVCQLPHGAALALPRYETFEAAGMDLMAAVDEEILLAPLQRSMIPTGLSIALPAGYEAQIRPRSGLAAKHGITVLNSPGTIDADYRGEIKVILINLGQESFTVTAGMRIAQMVIAPVVQGQWKKTDTLPDSSRGSGGFGSTGA